MNSRLIRIAMFTAVPWLAGAALAAANDPCSALLPQGKTVTAIQIVANGYSGRLGGVTGQGGTDQKGLQVTRSPDSTYRFSGQAHFDGEPPSTVQGTCKDRRIEFTRSTNGLAQTYNGYLFQKSRQEKAYTPSPVQSCGANLACMSEQSRAVGQEMSGLFTHNGSPPQYGWCARVVTIEQVY